MIIPCLIISNNNPINILYIYTTPQKDMASYAFTLSCTSTCYIRGKWDTFVCGYVVIPNNTSENKPKGVFYLIFYYT